MVATEYRRLILIGPQASGKGTQAQLLAKALGVAHISTGDLFRKQAQEQSPLGRTIKGILDRGELVPKELTFEIVKATLAHAPGYVLDGFPRTREQAEFLDTFATVDAVIVLDVPDAVCIERIGGRRICKNGHDFHVQYKPPQQDGVCDIDGLPLGIRDDDTPDAIKKRLAIFHSQTEPVIEHYRAQRKIIRIDGTPGIDDVAAAIRKRLGV